MIITGKHLGRRTFLRGAGVDTYASETRGVNLGQTISAVTQYIDIQNQLIKRGI